jgi:hypothetical protein
LFRADSLHHLGLLLSRLPEVHTSSVVEELTRSPVGNEAAQHVELVVLALSIGMLELVELVRSSGLTLRLSAVTRWCAWAFLCAWLGLTAVQTHSPFIYFRF